MDENSISSETTGESVMSLTSASMDGNNTCVHNRKHCKKCNFYYKPHINKTVRQSSNDPHILSSDESSLADKAKSETDKLNNSKKNMARKNLIESTDDVEKFNKRDKNEKRKNRSGSKTSQKSLSNENLKDKANMSKSVESGMNESVKSTLSKSIESHQSKSKSVMSTTDKSVKSNKSTTDKSVESNKSTTDKSVESNKSGMSESVKEDKPQEINEKQKMKEEQKLTEENKEEEKVIEKQAIKETNPLEKSKTPLSGRLISANEDPNVQVDRVGKINEKPTLKNFKVIGIPENTYLAALRRNNLVFIEGYVGKRMYFCSCFFHERYFILTKEGILIYLRNLYILEKNSERTGENEQGPNEEQAKCRVDEVEHEDLWIFSKPRFLNLNEAIDLQRIFKDGNTYPYRILIRHIDYDDELAFKEESIRDMWVERISWVINKSK